MTNFNRNEPGSMVDALSSLMGICYSKLTFCTPVSLLIMNRRPTYKPVKLAIKIGQALVTAFIGNFSNLQIGFYQQLACEVNPVFIQKTKKSFVECSFKKPAKGLLAHCHGRSNFFQRYFISVILLYKIINLIDPFTRL